MSRTAKRYINRDIKQTDDVKQNFYNAGIYTRLSHERTESWRNLSNSIDTQISYCTSYANKESIRIYKIYTDYEYSGTKFKNYKR